jgi:tetratricopeptide (TPR) repeat protein
MRIGILASILAVAVGIASWTAVQRHRQTQWLRAYREANDSLQRRHYADAEAQLRMILPQEKEPTSRQAAMTLNLLALIYHAQGHMKEAEPLFERAIHIFAKDGPSSSMDLAGACTAEGRMYLEEGRFQEADQKLQQALAIYQKEPAKAGAELGTTLHNLGLARIGEGRKTEAEPLLEQAIQIYQRTLSIDDLNLAQLYLDLAVEYRLEQKPKEAQAMDQKALQIQERVFGNDSPAARETRARLNLKVKDAPSPTPAKMKTSTLKSSPPKSPN